MSNQFEGNAGDETAKVACEFKVCLGWWVGEKQGDSVLSIFFSSLVCCWFTIVYYEHFFPSFLNWIKFTRFRSMWSELAGFRPPFSPPTSQLTTSKSPLSLRTKMVGANEGWFMQCPCNSGALFDIKMPFKHLNVNWILFLIHLEYHLKSLLIHVTICDIISGSLWSGSDRSGLLEIFKWAVRSGPVRTAQKINKSG